MISGILICLEAFADLTIDSVVRPTTSNL